MLACLSINSVSFLCELVLHLLSAMFPLFFDNITSSQCNPAFYTPSLKKALLMLLLLSRQTPSNYPFLVLTSIIIPSINISLSKSKSKYYHTFHLLYSLYSTLLHFPLSPSLLLHFPFLYSPSSITTLTFITLLLIFPFTFYTTLTFITLFHILHSPLLHFSSLALSILLTFHLPYSIFNITILPFIITFSITTLPLYSLFITQPLTNLLFINPSLHSQPPFNTFHIITHSSNIIFNKSLLLFITFHQ